MKKNLNITGERVLSVMFAMIVVSIASASILSAADRPPQKVNVAYSSISGNIAPLWVTQDKGFFRKYGLEVQAILIESGTTTAQALVASDISFASVAGPAKRRTLARAPPTREDKSLPSCPILCQSG